jgi:hypothetical protein
VIDKLRLRGARQAAQDNTHQFIPMKTLHVVGSFQQTDCWVGRVHLHSDYCSCSDRQFSPTNTLENVPGNPGTKARSGSIALFLRKLQCRSPSFFCTASVPTLMSHHISYGQFQMDLITLKFDTIVSPNRASAPSCRNCTEESPFRHLQFICSSDIVPSALDEQEMLLKTLHCCRGARGGITNCGHRTFASTPGAIFGGDGRMGGALKQVVAKAALGRIDWPSAGPDDDNDAETWNVIVVSH